MAKYTSSGRRQKKSPSQRRASYLARQERGFLASLVNLRKESGLTQAAVAELLGISQQAISKFESLESSPTLSTVISYAHAIDALVHFDAVLDSGRFEEYGEEWITSDIAPVPGNTATSSLETDKELRVTPEHIVGTESAEEFVGALRSEFALAARKSSPTDVLTDTQKEWVNQVIEKATPLLEGIPEYDADVLQELAPQIPRKVSEPENFRNLQTQLREVGVCLVSCESLPGGKISGVSFTIGSTPIVGLSGLGKRLDKVLFTLLHEIAHILNGDVAANKQTILHNVGDDFVTDMEKKADGLASRFVLGDRGLPTPPLYASHEWLDGVAADFGVHRIVIAGMLQHAGSIGYGKFSKGAPNVDEYLRDWE